MMYVGKIQSYNKVALKIFARLTVVIVESLCLRLHF